MKTKLFMLAVTAVMMAFTACTREVVIVKESDSSLQLGPGEDVIEINLTSTSNTRAARPITNSLPGNNINRIAFKFLDNDGTDLADAEISGIKIAQVINEEGNDITDDGYEIDQINNVLKLNKDFESGSNNVIRIKFEGLDNGRTQNGSASKSIRLIAYGYNVDEEEAAPDKFPYDINTFGQKGSSRNKLLSCDVPEGTPIEEIFAECDDDSGNSFVTINQHNRFTSIPNITLKRQVAALLVYFKEAPVFVDNKRVHKITVSTKYKGTGFYFPAALLENSMYNGIGGTWSGNSGVESDEYDKWIHYLTFDMSRSDRYYEDDSEYKSGETYKFSDGKDEGKRYLLADEMDDIDELECRDNTLFGSCFLLPFQSGLYLGVEAFKCATLNICYWNYDSILKKYSLITSIPLKKGEKDEEDSLNDSEYQYNILCNNFYSIGTKKITGLPDPEDGNPDDDIPVSIDEPTGWEYVKVSIDEGFDGENNLFN